MHVWLHKNSIVLWTHSNFERDAPRFKVEVKGPNTVYIKITHTHISLKAAYLMHFLLLGSLMLVLYNKELSSVTEILRIFVPFNKPNCISRSLRISNSQASLISGDSACRQKLLLWSTGKKFNVQCIVLHKQSSFYRYIYTVSYNIDILVMWWVYAGQKPLKINMSSHHSLPSMTDLSSTHTRVYML